MWKRILRAAAKAIMEEMLRESPRLVIHGAYRTIELTQGKHTYVSLEDYEWVSQYSWRASRHSRPGRPEKWYAKGNVNGKDVYMHRLIQGFPGGLVVDHIDGNGLNNTRGNLRSVTQKVNIDNSTFHKREFAEPFL